MPFLPRCRRTQRFEAHIWEDRRQVYLGGYDVSGSKPKISDLDHASPPFHTLPHPYLQLEESAAKAHDVIALRCSGRAEPRLDRFEGLEKLGIKLG